MKKVPHSVRKLTLTLMLISVHLTLIAQKIQNVQIGNVWAPTAVKIDGKLTEWGESLKAYNKNVQLWYTIANDDKNIYLVIKSTDLDNNNKILAGGISFTLNTEGKKKTKNAFTITFPIVKRAGGRIGHGGRRGGFGGDDTPDTAAIVTQQNQTLATGKEISAIGFADITDTLVSIYNEYGIKAAANIDVKGVMVYELAIPIKLLKIAVNDQKELAYNIKINGLPLNGGGFGGGNSFGGGSHSGGSGGGGGFGGGFGGGGKSEDVSDMMSPTDFWGKYILATKTTNQ
jgi:hypothetical protein